MKKKIKLPYNHTRAISSSLRIVERSLMELEELLLHQTSTCSTEIFKDVDDDTIAGNLTAIHEAREHICELSEKYGASKEKLNLQRIIDAKRTEIWAILTESLSERVKGYGRFPEKYADEYDSDIRKLIDITNKLSY